jgi:hypothetical protein
MTEINQKHIYFDFSQSLSIEKKLLLQAALGDHALCLKSWNEWKDRIDIENIESDAYPLLPLLYRNLLNSGINDHKITQLKGIYRRNWTKNQLFLSELTKICIGFSEANISYLILGDIAMNLSIYANLGDRMINNLELMIDLKNFDNSLRVLKELGWCFKVEIKESFIESYSSVYCWNNVGDRLQLYWRLWGSVLYHDISTKKIVLEFNNLAINVLDLPDQIIYNCSKIKLSGFKLKLYWLADIILILKQLQQKQNTNIELMLINIQEYHFAILFNAIAEVQNDLGILEKVFSQKISNISITAKEQREFYWTSWKKQFLPLPIIFSFLRYLKTKIINYRLKFLPRKSPNSGGL